MITVFGAGGFLGREVCAQLEAAGVEHVGLRSRDANICERASLDRLDISPSVVVNLAARVPAKGVKVADMMRTNAEGAVNVCEWAIERGVKKIVQGSTLSVVNRPWPEPLRENANTYAMGAAAPYAASKLAGEIAMRALCESAGVAFAALRYSALYGEQMSWQGVMCLFADMALRGDVPRVNAGGKVHADFLQVSDAARATISAALSFDDAAEGVFNIAQGEETSLLLLAQKLLKLCGRSETVLISDEGDASRALVDTARMRIDLCSVPQVSLDEGLERLLLWRRETHSLA